MAVTIKYSFEKGERFVSEISGDLAGTDLCHLDLRRANFENKDLSHTNLEGSDLSGANLRGATLTRTAVFNTCFASADLRDVDLSSVYGLDIYDENPNFQGTLFGRTSVDN